MKPRRFKLKISSDSKVALELVQYATQDPRHLLYVLEGNEVAAEVFLTDAEATALGEALIRAAGQK